MNLVGQHVKRSMLEYSSIFPTRLKVLEHDFFVLGNGKEWLADGTIGDPYNDEPRELPEGIYVEDVNERIESAKAEVAKYPDEADFFAGRIAKYEAEKAERLAILEDIDVLSLTVDPKGEIKGGYYGDIVNILADLSKQNYTGKPYLKIWNVPQNVEASWWAAANEVVEAAIRGSIHPDDREYMRMCWKAQKDFVQGRAEAFVVPVKPETYQERRIRLAARAALRSAAFDEVAGIKRILNRAGYTLPMTDKRRAKTDMSNGTYHMSVYETQAVSDATIAKIDRAMVKAGYTRSDNADLPTWENGKEHRVALRLFPFSDGLWTARVLVVGSPDDEHHPKNKGFFHAAQKKFDTPDKGSEYVAPVVPAAPRAIYQVLPGSLTVEGQTATAAVHTGSTEWDTKNLRYVRADLSKIADKNRTLVDILSETYDNTVGCLVAGGYAAKA